MSKQAVFTMKLEPELREHFMAKAAKEDRPTSQIMRELMRGYYWAAPPSTRIWRLLATQGWGCTQATWCWPAFLQWWSRRRSSRAPCRASAPYRWRDWTMKVRWIAGAKQDRADIVNYIAVENPRAVLKMDDLFSEATKKLAKFPSLGQIGKIPGTRELIPHKSYRLVYEVDEAEDTFWVMALVHTANLWPPMK